MKPRVFWLHYNRFGKKRGERMWTVHLSDMCIPAKSVEVNVPVCTVYKGDAAQQPRAYLKGKGTVHTKPMGRVVIN